MKEKLIRKNGMKYENDRCKKKEKKRKVKEKR